MPEGRSVAIAAALITAGGAIGAALITVQPWNKTDNPSSTVPRVTTGGGGGAPGPEFTLPDLQGSSVSVFLSRDSGPGGTTVNVSGEGFSAGERVVIRFHTEQIGDTTANSQGGFSNVAVVIPSSFSEFAPQQFEIIATGEQSAKSATAPFTISG